MEKFIVTIENQEYRLDNFILEKKQDLSRSEIQEMIKSQYILVNNKKSKSGYKLKTNDEIEIIDYIKKPEIKLFPQDIPLDIVYEDEHIAVVNKPRGMVVHYGAGNYKDTLVNALLYRYKDTLSKLNPDEFRPGIVHRIDKDTSGLLVIARSDLAYEKLSQQFRVHSIKRQYTFICNGSIKQDNFEINKPIDRNPNNRIKRAIIPGGREAITIIEVLKRCPKYTYARATLKTGRTHQIRVHMNSIGHSLVGDMLYSNNKSKIQGQLLHAGTLGFIHPATQEYMEFHSEEPNIFKEFLNKYF